MGEVERGEVRQALEGGGAEARQIVVGEVKPAQVGHLAEVRQLLEAVVAEVEFAQLHQVEEGTGAQRPDAVHRQPEHLQAAQLGTPEERVDVAGVGARQVELAQRRGVHRAEQALEVGLRDVDVTGEGEGRESGQRGERVAVQPPQAARRQVDGPLDGRVPVQRRAERVRRQAREPVAAQVEQAELGERTPAGAEPQLRQPVVGEVDAPQARHGEQRGVRQRGQGVVAQVEQAQQRVVAEEVQREGAQPVASEVQLGELGEAGERVLLQPPQPVVLHAQRLERAAHGRVAQHLDAVAVEDEREGAGRDAVRHRGQLRVAARRHRVGAVAWRRAWRGDGQRSLTHRDVREQRQHDPRVDPPEGATLHPDGTKTQRVDIIAQAATLSIQWSSAKLRSVNVLGRFAHRCGRICDICCRQLHSLEGFPDLHWSMARLACRCHKCSLISWSPAARLLIGSGLHWSSRNEQRHWTPD